MPNLHRVRLLSWGEGKGSGTNSGGARKVREREQWLQSKLGQFGDKRAVCEEGLWADNDDTAILLFLSFSTFTCMIMIITSRPGPGQSIATAAAAADTAAVALDRSTGGHVHYDHQFMCLCLSVRQWTYYLFMSSSIRLWTDCDAHRTLCLLLVQFSKSKYVCVCLAPAHETVTWWWRSPVCTIVIVHCTLSFGCRVHSFSKCYLKKLAANFCFFVFY